MRMGKVLRETSFIRLNFAAGHMGSNRQYSAHCCRVQALIWQAHISHNTQSDLSLIITAKLPDYHVWFWGHFRDRALTMGLSLNNRSECYPFQRYFYSEPTLICIINILFYLFIYILLTFMSFPNTLKAFHIHWNPYFLFRFFLCCPLYPGLSLFIGKSNLQYIRMIFALANINFYFFLLYF